MCLYVSLLSHSVVHVTHRLNKMLIFLQEIIQAYRFSATGEGWPIFFSVKLGQSVVLLGTQACSVSPVSTYSRMGQSATYWCPVGYKIYIEYILCCV